jgi:uncharacterized protein (DUF2062 family)
MPVPDPVPPLGRAFRRRYLRLLKIGAAFSAVIAAIAVLLVSQGQPELHIHMLIATALGVGLTVFLGIALMSLVFISNSSGHDAEAADHHIKEEE